jgi:hypothetical protein
VSNTAAVQAAIKAGSFTFGPGIYNLSGDIQIPSNRHIWVQKGATVINKGGRFTAYVPGGGNIDFRIDGKMSFPETKTAHSIPAWEYNDQWHNRGIIEFGGSVEKPATNIKIYGTGEVFSDYPWPGNPPSAFTDIKAQLNRKGICLFNSVKSRIRGLDVHNIYGEAVYYQAGSKGEFDVKLTDNNVHEVAFNGVNINAWGGQGFVIADNYIQNAWQGIEFSAGRCKDNHIIGVYKGILTGGGGGAGPLYCQDNVVVASTFPFEFSFNPDCVENVIVTGNTAQNAQGTAFTFDRINSFLVENNIAYGYAQSIPGAAFFFANTCGNGHVGPNIIRGAGPKSLGGIINQAGSTVTTEANPVL